jgi:hypothetical protein
MLYQGRLKRQACAAPSDSLIILDFVGFEELGIAGILAPPTLEPRLLHSGSGFS